MSDDDQGFDDWFNDAADAENDAGMQNQAAKFDIKVKEDRERVTENFGPQCALAGQVFVGFSNAADPTKKFKKAFSGHIVQKIDDDTYVMLTAAHCLEYSQAGNSADIGCGYFFLQKSGKGQFAASFTFDQGDIQIYEGYKSPSADELKILGTQGNDVAAVKLTVKKIKTEIPEVPELEENAEPDASAKDFYMSGYPEQSIITLTEEETKAGANKYVTEGNTLFQMKGAIEGVNTADANDGQYAIFSMDATKGQDGGAVTNAEGKVVAIYSAIASVTTPKADDFYCGTFIDATFMDWYSGLDF